MRSRQEVERDLAEARSQLTAAEAGDRTNRRAWITTCAAAQAEVERFETELAALPAVVIPPARVPRTAPVAVVANPPVAIPVVAGTAPVITPATPPVRRRRAAPVAPPPVPPVAPIICGPRRNWTPWPWVVGGLVALLLLVWGLQVFPPERQQVNTGRRVSAPTVRTPVVRPSPTSQPTYRDCMFLYGERRELADGRCDYLSQ